MQKRLLLDTDMMSEVLKAVDANVASNAASYALDFGALEFTSISVLEILNGLYRKRAATQIQLALAIFARNNEVVPERPDYRLAGEIAGALTRQGTPIGIVDPLIASCAIRLGVGVATGNVDHFNYITQAGYALHIENWRAI